MMDVILYRWYSNAKLFGRKFIYDEDGAVSIVTIVVLNGIAILLAVVFRKQIETLLNTLFSSINKSGTDAIKDTPKE